MIGYERQHRQRTAGLRTNVLAAVGGSIFVDMANRLAGHDGAVRVVAYVVSGIGFLGAGVIMREEGNVRGLNTAATLWGSAAVGASAGADLILEAALGCLFVPAANTLLRPLVNRINQQPMDTPAVEVTNTVYVIAPRLRQKEALRLLEDALEASNHPTRDLVVTPSARTTSRSRRCRWQRPSMAISSIASWRNWPNPMASARHSGARAPPKSHPFQGD